MQRIADLQLKLGWKFDLYTTDENQGFRISFKLPAGESVNFMFRGNATVRVRLLLCV